jgi:hypothetical protein
MLAMDEQFPQHSAMTTPCSPGLHGGWPPGIDEMEWDQNLGGIEWAPPNAGFESGSYPELPLLTTGHQPFPQGAEEPQHAYDDSVLAGSYHDPYRHL